MAEKVERVFPIKMGSTRFQAKLSIEFGAYHLVLESYEGKPEFFSGSGFLSHFFGFIEKAEREEAVAWVNSVTEDYIVGLVKKLCPNYPKTLNPACQQQTLF